MAEMFLDTALFPLALTLGAFHIGLFIQKKGKHPAFNPILIAIALIIPILLLLGYPMESYQAGTAGLSWLLTPATVCLALPLYEQGKVLKKNLPAIFAGVTAGTLASLLVVLGLCRLLQLSPVSEVSLLPKSITTAMGIVLSQQNGGLEALTTAAIIITGIFGAVAGTGLCRLLRLHDPVSQGVAFGTASHVVGTSRATELNPLTGAVSSLSLTVAGILTALIFPLFL